MSAPTAPNPSTATARVVADELARAGVTDVVLAPGSRSAALALAVAADERLRTHVEIDERSAGFCALGLARASGRPAAVVTTSGTAVANVFPAVVEAAEARQPLLVVSANRPPELRDTGANQTIDQTKLFGDRVRFFAEIGVAADRPGEPQAWRSVVARAVAEARGLSAAPGPAHLDVAFREPTVPVGDDGRSHAPAYTQPLDGRADGRPWTAVDRAPRRPGADAVAALAARLAAAPRGLIVLGDAAASAGPALDLARAVGWPVVAEPLAAARTGLPAPAARAAADPADGPVLSAAPYLAAHRRFAAAHQPDLVVRVGRSGLSRAVAGLVGAASQVLVDPDGAWLDPDRTTGDLVVADPDLLLAALADRLAGDGAASQPSWLASWQAADAAATAAVHRVLDGEEAASEPGAARAAAASVPDGGLLVAGSSMPVRDLDLVMRPRRGVRVIGNRGASGIDGIVSTALGAALGADAPVVGLVGDLALLHDAGGLLLAPEAARLDCVLVVLDNDGGGIFSFLPTAAHTAPATFERVFATPHGRDVADLARLHRVGHTRAECAGDVEPAIADALAAGGVHLVEVRTDRAANRALHRAMEEAASAAIDAVAPA